MLTGEVLSEGIEGQVPAESWPGLLYAFSGLDMLTGAGPSLLAHPVTMTPAGWLAATYDGEVFRLRSVLLPFEVHLGFDCVPSGNPVEPVRQRC